MVAVGGMEIKVAVKYLCWAGFAKCSELNQ